MPFKSLFILSLSLIITGCDGSAPCSERATTYYPKKEEGFTVFSISNNSADGIKGDYTKFTDTHPNGMPIEHTGIIAELPICIGYGPLRTEVKSLEVLSFEKSVSDCHQEFIDGYEEGKTVFIKPSGFGVGQTAWYITDYHLVIDDFKFSKEDEWICK